MQEIIKDIQENPIQSIAISAVILGVTSLALWTLPDNYTAIDVFAHLSFELIRAAILIGNVRIAKQTQSWWKPLVVFIGSLVLTALMGIQIVAEYSVTYETLFSSSNPNAYFSKQAANIGVLFVEITLALMLGSDSSNYKKLSKESQEWEDKYMSLGGSMRELCELHKINHEDYETWLEVVNGIVKASKSEQKVLETFKISLETVKNDLETVKPRLEMFKKSLELNRILFKNSKVSVNGYAPIFHEECGTINETSSNNQRSVICSGCGKEATKEFKTQIRKFKNG